MLEDWYFYIHKKYVIQLLKSICMSSMWQSIGWIQHGHLVNNWMSVQGYIQRIADEFCQSSKCHKCL